MIESHSEQLEERDLSRPVVLFVDVPPLNRSRMAFFVPCPVKSASVPTAIVHSSRQSFCPFCSCSWGSMKAGGVEIKSSDRISSQENVQAAS